MSQRGCVVAARAALFAFATYLRLSEVLGLRNQDIVRPPQKRRRASAQGTSARWLLVLHPAEVGIRFK
eukprot:6572081-Lingulodinium_polyedra.AAC.1